MDDVMIRAMRIAYNAHTCQTDKAGMPYIEHPHRVSMRMKTEEEMIVAWLHDVPEDTDVTVSELRDKFGDVVGDALEAITHRKGESWSDYLARVKANEIATRVKIADLIDNSNLDRLEDVTARDVLRQAKYNRALIFLMEIDGE